MGLLALCEESSHPGGNEFWCRDGFGPPGGINQEAFGLLKEVTKKDTVTGVFFIRRLGRKLDGWRRGVLSISFVCLASEQSAQATCDARAVDAGVEEFAKKRFGLVTFGFIYLAFCLVARSSIDDRCGVDDRWRCCDCSCHDGKGLGSALVPWAGRSQGVCGQEAGDENGFGVHVRKMGGNLIWTRPACVKDSSGSSSSGII
jgi:hypothetical protein